MTVASAPSISSALHLRLASFLAERHARTSLLHSVQCRVRYSVSVIGKALRCYGFPEEIALSYNGGKDCLVMAVLILACLNGLGDLEMDVGEGDPERRQQHNGRANGGQNGGCQGDEEQGTDAEEEDKGERGVENGVIGGEDGVRADEINDSSPVNEHQHQHHSPQQPPPPISAIYAQPPDPFPAVDSFVSSSAATYNLAVTRLSTAPPNSSLRSAFATYLASHPRIRAIFVGTRKSDPYGASLQPFQPTDSGWPDFMRIHPILDWQYSEIWAFLRHLDVEYCPLYDQGYTSLGDASNTNPNPRLEVQAPGQRDAAATGAYLPAYELKSDEEERLGRG